MESRESRAHCHGRSSATGDRCCRSRHDSGNPRTRCPRRHSPDCPSGSRRKSEEKEEAKKHNETMVEIAPVARYDKFAQAKRLHAENLQHQPLPDRVDDRVFGNANVAHGHRLCSAGCEAAKRQAQVLTMEEQRFGPALGCKEPKTRMDLAICWETPIDPVYEPHRPTHVDDSEGGTAPAIFALIQHTPAPTNRELLTHGRAEIDGDERDRAATRKTRTRDRCCCECLCDGMESIAVAETAKKSKTLKPSPRITERRCAACEPLAAKQADDERRHRDPRLIKSAVGIALGLERRSDAARRNGLPPAGVTVPRPRTPFARRSFCIDTLAPPFSVVSGCRDADYPEHWRLMSVYQQSYRNPQRRRSRHF